MYLSAGLPLHAGIDNLNNFRSIRYRTILKTDTPKELIKKLSSNNIKAITPIEDWELLSPTKNALEYCQKNISLPIYPALTDEQVQTIIRVLQ